MRPVVRDIWLRVRGLAPTSWDQAFVGGCVLAVLATGHRAALGMTVCPRSSWGSLDFIGCPWQIRVAGFALLVVLALIVPFLLGLWRREVWTGVLSPLGYSIALALWQRWPGQRFAYDLTYGLSPFEFFMDRVAAYCVFMLVTFAVGRAVREVWLQRQAREA